MSECRICASTSAIFLNIFQKNDARKYDVEINTCLPIKVTTDDVISLKVCHVCVHKLELCNAFVCHFLTTEPQRQMDSGQNVCYLCLKNDGVLSSLFDGNFSWIHQIETALGCKVHKGKKVPSKICHHCAYMLGELYQLFLSALESESKLYLMCEFPKVNNKNQNFVATDTKAVKSSVKINQLPVPSKSPGANKKLLPVGIKNLEENSIVRVSRRNVKPSELRTVPASVLSYLNSNVLKVTVSKLSGSGAQAVGPQQHQNGNISVTANKIRHKDKPSEVSHQILAGRITRKGTAAPKTSQENKQVPVTKGNKAMLKPVHNIQVACWKCFRNLKDNETCSCSTDFESGKKIKAGQKVNANASLNNIPSFNKTETAHSKRKRESEETDSDNSKRVRGDSKKVVQKKKESFPLMSHLYDIRRTKRKRTITDYNQLLNDGLLLSPRADRVKKDVKPVQRGTPFKEASKTLPANRQSHAASSRRNSHKSTNIKLENQENLPQKHLSQKVKSLETSNLKGAHAYVQSKKTSPKSGKMSKLPPKRRQDDVGTADNTVEILEPPEKLNKYECSVCSSQFPSTVEGKLHEVEHTARVMKLIMYRWGADSRSSNSSKQSQKNAVKRDIESVGVTKVIKKVLQDVVSMVSLGNSKVQSVNGSKITRTRTGRIVVSKVQIIKKSRPAKSKDGRTADSLKHNETVRSIISDFESLEEGEDTMEACSPTVIESSGKPAVKDMEVNESARENNSEEYLQQDSIGSIETKYSPIEEHADHSTEDFDSDSRSRKQKGESASSNVPSVLALEREGHADNRDEMCELGSDQGDVDAVSVEREGSRERDVESGDFTREDGADASSTDKSGGEELDKVTAEASARSPIRLVGEDVVDVEDRVSGSSGSSIIVDETPSNMDADPQSAGIVDSSDDAHASIEKEIYELHGDETVNFTPPKSVDTVSSSVSQESSASDKVLPESNETDLIHILE